MRALGNISDSEASKICQPTTALTVSSNFEVAASEASCSSLVASILSLTFVLICIV